MCGIIGVVYSQEGGVDGQTAREDARRLLLLSESRGKEAAGMAVMSDQRTTVYKEPVPASVFVENKKFSDLFNTQTRAFIGHARLVTNGSMLLAHNNQPVIVDDLIGVHNGIIVNDAKLWAQYPDLRRQYEVDTEVLLAILSRQLHAGRGIRDKVVETLAQIKGTASAAVLSTKLNTLMLFTNNGSLYYAHDARRIVFASEKMILRKFFKKDVQEIRQLPPGTAAIFPLSKGDTGGVQIIPSDSPDRTEVSINTAVSTKSWQDLFDAASLQIETVPRCSRCILPATMPFIEFDEYGVCNYCRNHRPIHV